MSRLNSEALAAIDPNDGRVIRRIVFPGGIASLVPAPDGARIAVVNLTGRVRIANVPGFEIAAELPRDHVTASASGYEIVLEFSGDGRRLATVRTTSSRFGMREPYAINSTFLIMKAWSRHSRSRR